MTYDCKPCVPNKYILENGFAMEIPKGDTKLEIFSKRAVEVFDDFYDRFVKYQQDNNNRSPP